MASALKEMVGSRQESWGYDEYLEVIAEGPITEHLKEGMVVRVFTDIIQIYKRRVRDYLPRSTMIEHTIVLATSTNAFLSIEGSLPSGHW